ncbi:MAG: DUF433 domain-containing protein [Thermodesulfobacteriota bacterium]
MRHIEINPKVCNGKPVIKGTRIPVSIILECLAEGDTWQTLMAGYPELTEEDIRSALLYAMNFNEH